MWRAVTIKPPDAEDHLGFYWEFDSTTTTDSQALHMALTQHDPGDNYIAHFTNI